PTWSSSATSPTAKSWPRSPRPGGGGAPTRAPRWRSTGSRPPPGCRKRASGSRSRPRDRRHGQLAALVGADRVEAGHQGRGAGGEGRLRGPVEVEVGGPRPLEVDALAGPQRPAPLVRPDDRIAEPGAGLERLDHRRRARLTPGGLAVVAHPDLPQPRAERLVV